MERTGWEGSLDGRWETKGDGWRGVSRRKEDFEGGTEEEQGEKKDEGDGGGDTQCKCPNPCEKNLEKNEGGGMEDDGWKSRERDI